MDEHEIAFWPVRTAMGYTVFIMVTPFESEEDALEHGQLVVDMLTGWEGETLH